MAKFKLGNMDFPSKKALSSTLTQIINTEPIGRQLDEFESALAQEMALNHVNTADKIGVGIAHFITGKNDYGKNCIKIVRVDGTEETIAVNLAKYTGSDNSQADFNAACRKAVYPQIVEFRKTVTEADGRFICAVTGEKLEWDEGSIDHIYPLTFSMIVKTFIEQNNIEITTELTKPSDGDGRDFADKTLQESFCEFHGEHAQLRPIKSSINLSLGNRIN